MELQTLIQRAMHVRQRYVQYEGVCYGRNWSDEEIALGLVGDVGDLVKLIVAKNGVRSIDIDLEQVFCTTMDQIEQHLELSSSEGVSP